MKKKKTAMKRFCSVLLTLCVCLASFVFVGCDFPFGGDAGGGGNSGGNKQELGENYSGVNDKIADFTLGLSSNFHAANKWTNGGMFDCRWQTANVRYNGKNLELTFSKDAQTGENNAGEYRTNGFFGYGYYSVKMKAVAKPGVVTSFFTYTGRSDGNPWDEIDVEFLGKDTTKVQFNYFTDGVGGHEYLYNLGFDASKEMHEYGFKWAQDSITWYVDSVPVYRATKDIPVTQGRIMINAWPGKAEGSESVANWSGVFDGVYPIAPAEYEWIGYKALD